MTHVRTMQDAQLVRTTRSLTPQQRLARMKDIAALVGSI